MTSDRDAKLTLITLSGGVLIFGKFLELGIAFIGKLLIARFFGSVGFGAVSIGLAVATLLSGIGLLALHVGLGRFLPRATSPAEERGILISAFHISMPLLLVLGIGIFVFANPLASLVFDDPDLAPVLRVFSGMIPLIGVVKLALGASQGYQETRLKVAIENLTLPVVRIASIAAVVLIGLGIVGIAGAYLLAYLLAGVVALVYLLRNTPLLSRRPYTPRYRELLTFSTPLVLMAVTGSLLADLDTLLLAYFRGTSDVGIYNVAYEFSRTGLSILTPIGFIVMPVMSELEAAGRWDDIDDLFTFVTKWVILLTLPIGAILVLFPETILGGLFGPEFSAGATSLVILSVGFFFTGSLRQVSELLKSFDETRRLLVGSLLATAVNIILNLVLIPPFGIEGAAVATTTAFIAQYSYLTRNLAAVTGLFPLDRTTLTFAGGTAVMVAVLGTILSASTGPLMAMGMTTVLLGVYLVLLLTFAVDRDEIMLVLSFEEEFEVDLEPLKKIARLVVDVNDSE